MSQSGPVTVKNPEQIALAKDLNHVPWCDDYEKMISGMIFNPFPVELTTVRLNARRLCHEYNTAFPHDFASTMTERAAHLQALFGSISPDCYLEPPLQLDYGCNTRFGAGCFANFGLTILDCALVTIGDRVMFGPNVSLLTVTHGTEPQSRRDMEGWARPIVIGSDCWIGGNAVVLCGVTIGKGVTVAAGSVVTRDVPDWSVAMGQPARVVRKVTPVPDLPPGTGLVAPCATEAMLPGAGGSGEVAKQEAEKTA